MFNLYFFMAKPLDHYVEHRTGTVRTARLFSNIVSPPVMFAILGLAFSLYERPSLNGLLWAAVYGFFVSLLPILFVLYLLKTGRIAELHMSNTGERHIPYLSAVLSAGIAFGLISFFDGPELLRCLTIFNMIELTSLGIINAFWLISLHATGIMATFLLVGLVFGWAYSLVVLPFVFLVCIVRLYLRRHTSMQVIAGLGLGVVTVYIMTLMECFI
jgi:membrane-associated phospholipid phosphatase